MEKEVLSVDQAPIPYYPSRRLIGLEIEIDSGGARFHEPILPSGWVGKHDGSLTAGKGYEYVLDPPLPLVDALNPVKEFSKAVVAAKMHVHQKGGFHVHVQGHDYTMADAISLGKLYQHYQKVIDLLVGASRRSNLGRQLYNPPLMGEINEAWMVSHVHLDEPARNRADAKGSRNRDVINFAPLRCEHKLERSIEFRQPSTSKHTVNIYGWACLASALVDFARHKIKVNRHLVCKPTLKNFMLIMKYCERTGGGQNLCNWVQWRADYLAQTPSEDLRRRFLELLLPASMGLFSIARKLNINLAVAKRLISSEHEKNGLYEVSPGRFRVNYDRLAEIDLKHLIDDWHSRENPAQPRQPRTSVNAPLPQPAVSPEVSSNATQAVGHGET